MQEVSRYIVLVRFSDTWYGVDFTDRHHLLMRVQHHRQYAFIHNIQPALSE